MRLTPGRYTLAVSSGEGPAGVQRGDDGDVVLDVEGGRVDFTVPVREEVYYWWRGPEERPGVRLLGISGGDGRSSGREEERWPTGTTG